MTVTSTARRVALVGMLALVASLLPFAGASAQDDLVALDLDASTNVDYAIRWSQVTYPQEDIDAGTGPTEALLGRDDIFADSLASGSLQDNTPLLLTPSDNLSANTAAELERLGVDTVTILGLEAAVSTDVEDELEALGYTVNRFGGPTRIETAIEIAGEGAGDTAILARAFANEDPTQAFADSLAAGGWAAQTGFPVLLTQTEVLTGNTRDHIEAAGYENVIIVGGDAAVSDEVEAEVAALVTNVDRVEGANRFETAVAIAAARGFDSAADTDLTILVDGQGADAWADGFSAANLAGSAPAPIVLSNSADDSLPPSTVTFLEGGAPAEGASFSEHLTNVVLICGSTVPDGDEGSASDQCTEAADILGATVVGFVPPGEVGVTVSETTVARGEDVTITITGAQVGDEIIVSGCGIEETTVTVTEDDIDEDGNVVLTFTIPQSQAEGDCDITVSVNGEEFVSTITVTEPPGNLAVTTRPELVRAEIVSFVTQGEVTPTSPAGVRVLYTYDEPISSANAGLHWVYESDANPAGGTGGNTATIQADNTQVLITFATAAYDTQAEVDTLTLATISENAATDFQGMGSPLGDAPIGTSSSAAGGAAGVTDAPDLTGVSGFRQAATAMQTAVDFTFDEAAFVTGAGDFQLIPTDGSAPITCTGPAAGSTNAGGTVAGGNGTTTITVICDNPGGATSPIAPATIARGVVLQGTVADTTAGVNPNPTQAADVSAAGNSIDPDLMSAVFQFDATNTGGVNRDAVVYLFDQNVNPLTIDCTDFGAYSNTGAQIAPIACAGADAVQVSGAQVRVFYNDGALTNAVGAFVLPGAAADSANALLVNETDEVGVQNDFVTSRVRGETAAPQMASARVERAASPFPGQEGNWQVVITYDEQVTVNNQAGYVLYQANGTRNVSSTCSVGATTATNNIVTCTAFTGIDNATQNATIGSGVLLGSQFGTVQDTGGTPNPEESEVLEGSTGTPAS